VTHDAFLAAILAAPDDDAPRLIYADYLDEQGECDRAEFIRVQVALWLDSNDITASGVQALTGASFFPGLCQLALGNHGNIGNAGVASLVEGSPMWLRWLDLMRCGIGDEGIRALASCPHLTHLTGLGLANNAISDEGAQALAASPYLSRIVRLGLVENPIGPAGRRALRARFKRGLRFQHRRHWRRRQATGETRHATCRHVRFSQIA
jgi:uncharacterized protein (TIGR02996 family)